MQKSARDIVVIERAVNGVARQHTRQRQITAGQTFGQTNKIGQDRSLFIREHRPRPPEAGHDFIRDQMHAVLIAQRTCIAQIICVIDAHAGSTLHQRLHNQRGNFMMLYRK